MVSFTDLSFCPRLSDLIKMGDYSPECVFMVDCPTLIADSVLVLMHTQIMSNFHEELYNYGTLLYSIYSYTMSDEVVTYLSQ
jgi:hypothetical protein